MITILISENRSKDPVRFARNRVRVFIGKDYSYGLWVDEDQLFELLTVGQKRSYLLEPMGNSLTFSVDSKTARKIVDLGYTLESKAKLLRQLETVAG